MSITGTFGSVTAPSETNNGLGGIATGIGIGTNGNTRDALFAVGTIALDCDVGPGFVGNIASVAAPTKRLRYCKAIADVPPGAAIVNADGAVWNNETGGVLPEGHYCWGVEA